MGKVYTLWVHGPLTWRPRGLTKSVISRVKIGVTPFRVLSPKPETLKP